MVSATARARVLGPFPFQNWAIALDNPQVHSLRLPRVAVLLLVIAGCSPSMGGGSTPSSESESTSTTTMTVLSTPTSSTTPPTSTTSSTTEMPQGDPELKLLPSGFFDTIRVGEIDSYYIFGKDTGATSYTTTFVTPDLDLEQRADGERSHLILRGLDGGEFIATEDGSWSKAPKQDWERFPEGEGGSEYLAQLHYYATPDLVYLLVYHVFEDLEFGGWDDVGPESEAIYMGGTGVAEILLDELGGPDGFGNGSVEARWNPRGYFSHLEIRVGGDVFAEWAVFDVDSTTVESPTD